MTRSERYLFLDGQWAFHFSPSSDATPDDFEKPNCDASAWKTIKVPAADPTRPIRPALTAGLSRSPPGRAART